MFLNTEETAQLERLATAGGIEGLLDALAAICNEKADNIRIYWAGDAKAELYRHWQDCARVLAKAREQLPAMPELPAHSRITVDATGLPPAISPNRDLHAPEAQATTDVSDISAAEFAALFQKGAPAAPAIDDAELLARFAIGLPACEEQGEGELLVLGVKANVFRVQPRNGKLPDGQTHKDFTNPRLAFKYAMTIVETLISDECLDLEETLGL